MNPLILHVRASNFFGGPERQIIGHIQTSKQFRHLVVTFQEGNLENEFQSICTEQGIAVAAIKTSHSYQWSSVQQLRTCILEKQPALICCHGYRPLALSLLAKIGTKIPIIAFSRGHTSENLKIRIFEFLERKLYTFADKIIAVSQGYAEGLKKHGIEAKRIEVILNAINPDKFSSSIEKSEQTRRELGFANGDFLIATAGRLSPEKAQGDLIKAFAQLYNKHNHVRLVLCGNGPLREQLERQSVELKCPAVHFLGHRNDLDNLMPAFDLFVLPSLTEGLPNVLLEAASCHIPIVATRVGGVPEVITDGESGLLVEPANVAQLAKAMDQYVANPELRTRYSNVAYVEIVKKFGFAEQTLRLENLYRQMLTA